MDFDKRLKHHKDGVRDYLSFIVNLLASRALTHDNSKSSDEEYKYYKMANSVNRNDFKSYEEYLNYIKPTLDKGLKHHYNVNRHHPEYFDNGIDDMTLIDILEMIVDWKISIEQNGKDLYEEIEYNFDKYNVSEQLKKVILNTYKYIDKLMKEE